MTPRACDVLVVGAGPAGAATALFAARAGLDVVLVDKRRFPRDKICGDAVARKSLAILRELGIMPPLDASSHERIGRALLASPNGCELDIDLSSPDEPLPHAVCRREVFDALLVDAARTRVAHLLEDTAVLDVTRDGTRVTGVSVRHNGATRTIAARVVVGADGFDSVVARRLGHYKHDSTRWFVATRGYYRGLEIAPGSVEVRYVGDTLPGFLWIFPSGDGIANVGLGLVHRDLKRRGGKLRDIHERVIDSPALRGRFRRAERIGTVHGWNLPTPDPRRVLAGDGFVLVGDAAGLVDPFSGEGIGNAMVSGKVAAHTIAESLRGEAEHPLAAAYPRRLWSELDAGEIALHYRLRSLARHARAIDFLVGRAAAHRDVLTWVQGMTTAHGAIARKRTLLSPLTYARLLLKR